jgi:hypothetical protein
VCGLVCVAIVCSALDGSTSVGCHLSSCVHICVCGFHRQVRGLDASDVSSAARTVQYVTVQNCEWYYLSVLIAHNGY